MIADMPNKRKVHTDPVPRIGGIAMAFGVFLPFPFQGLMDQVSLAIFYGTFIIIIFGIADDSLQLGHRMKFVGQLIAALVLVIFGDLSITSLGVVLPEGYSLPTWIS